MVVTMAMESPNAIEVRILYISVLRAYGELVLVRDKNTSQNEHSL
jgi:hypothetical protein